MSLHVPVIEILDVLGPADCDREIQRAGKLGFLSQQFRGEDPIAFKAAVGMSARDWRKWSSQQA